VNVDLNTAFISKSKQIHGDKYNYDKVEYKNSHTKVTITCTVHGDFEQKPYSHLQGHGCSKCMVSNNTYTTETFVEKANQVHSNKYDYTKTKYINSKSKVTITCPVHGDFLQKANTHTSGHGCPKCSPNYLKDTNTFITNANKIHRLKYDYSKTKYTDATSEIIVTCKKHGEFSQVATTHLRGHGCPVCKSEKISSLFKDTTESFIEKAKEVHGDKYDYSKVVYLNSNTPVDIICKTHDVFKQKPNIHLTGAGCQICSIESRSINNKLDINTFIEKANKIHNGKYNYTKVEYKNNHTKITITCPKHGDFEQIPSVHLKKSGCPYCSYNKKLTTESFIEKAKEVHGDKYDYSKVNYVNTITKVTITCPKHTDFTQSPDKHLQNRGCPKCGRERMSSSLSLSTEQFIKKAKKKHGDRYDYSQANYINGRTDVTIICKEHGVFSQNAANHINGSNCPKCEGKALVSTEDFINRSNIIHNNFYDYTLVNLKNTKDKVTIICPKHGKFKQIPNNHLNSAGCPVCKASKGEKSIKNILDKYKIKYELQYSIPEIVSKLKYDFYLPEYRLLIEFHGKQHYEYIPFFHRNGEDDFLVQKNRDDIIKHNAKFYKYNYLEFNYKQLKDTTKEEFEELVINSIKKV